MRYILLCCVVYASFGIVSLGIAAFLAILWIMAILAGATTCAFLIGLTIMMGCYLFGIILRMIKGWLCEN